MCKKYQWDYLFFYLSIKFTIRKRAGRHNVLTSSRSWIFLWSTILARSFCRYNMAAWGSRSANSWNLYFLRRYLHWRSRCSVDRRQSCEKMAKISLGETAEKRFLHQFMGAAIPLRINQYKFISRYKKFITILIFLLSH